MEIDVPRVHTAILFAILFVTVGWIAPAAYASYAPQDHFIQVHEFSAEDTTTDSDSHLICFDRTVSNGQSGKVFTELYLVNGHDNERVEVDSRTMERYFQEGRSHVETPFALPQHIQPGEYRYVLVVQMELAQGRVQREFSFTSETFTITDDPTNTNTTTKDFAC